MPNLDTDISMAHLYANRIFIYVSCSITLGVLCSIASRCRDSVPQNDIKKTFTYHLKEAEMKVTYVCLRVLQN